MPSIDVAMARSVQPSPWLSIRDALVRSIANDLHRRNIVEDTQGKVTDIQTALSSWDNCMAASFCKWPVIAIMVVGGLILLSIVVCIVRCCCCGMSCCCSCFSCLKCCGNCCGCCDAPGEKKNKYLDDPYSGPTNHGYQAQGPMQAPFHAAPQQQGFHGGPPARSAPAAAAPPQYAEFDVSKKGGEDSLPAMPSWEGASSKKVMEEDAVEMEPLKTSPAPQPQSNPPLASVPGNGSGSTSPLPQGQRSPYGPPQGGPMGGPGGYMPAPNQARDPYAQDPYAPHSPSFASTPQPQTDDGYGLDQPYDAVGGAAMAAATIPNRHTPTNDRNGYGQQRPANQGFAEMPELPGEKYNGGYGQQMNNAPPGPRGYGMRRQGTGESQRGPDGYGMRRQGTGDSRAGPDGYGMRRQNTGEGRPGPDGYGMRRQGTGEGRPGPDGYGMRRQDTGERMGAPVPYGMDPRARQSPGPRRTPGPQDNPYNQSPRQSPAPSRSPAFGGQQGYRPPPPQDPYAQHHQQSAPQPQELPALSRTELPASQERPYAQSPPQSPIVNNGGFDFNSGYSRPTTSGQTSPTADGYPGYKPYQPAQQGQQGWSGV
ncbi:hypothetical protein CC79DRAFT_433680 [Sarocladium strictum]